jgi:nicotinate phosphoribosyltransferase
MMIDLAYRAYSHSYKIDPIVRTLLDTDMYKFLMGQAIWKRHRHVQATFSLINRNKDVRLADLFSEQELREQLDHARSLSYSNNELIWLQGNMFYGKRGMFGPGYIEFLRRFRLPEYELRATADGQYDLQFPGALVDTTHWEVPSVVIISELRNRAVLHQTGRFGLDVLYAAAKTKLWAKLQKLKPLEALNLTDFGTRRRHSFLFQEWAILAAREVLGDAFTGTSNAYLAMQHGFEAKGTNAHERPMVAAALANTDEELQQSQYDVLTEWAQMYDGALLIALPDTYGTTQFLQNAPDWVADWTGMRHDSKDPATAGEEAIQWWLQRGRDPTTKLSLFTDGLDVDSIIALHNQFHGRTKVGFGWGSLLTNDFRGCHPDFSLALDPFSVVCKVATVNGRPAVKLSDNYGKATGYPNDIARYRQAFGSAGIANIPVIV